MFLYLFSAAQQASVKGMVADTAEHKAVVNAVVTLSRKSDSTLVAFTRTDTAGRFQLFQIPIGQYKVLVTFPKFADFSDEVDIKDGELDMGRIALTNKSTLLKEVIVHSAGAIRIKGDTTEYVADSFLVKEGATVEDLMKKLPGFQVNSKGEITAQGQKVQKVLVDGEEFFGDDPTMATQNIAAKAVDKVQVFDTKSEQQNIKGISTGTDGKTVNIKLKDDKKRGAFGKVEAGSDFNDIVDAKGMYNRFIGKKKLSLYATKSNVNTGSLNWEDRQKLGLEDNDMEYDEIGGYYYSFGNDDEFNDWSLRGLPNSYSAGALFSNKWNGDQQGINGSYRYNRLGTINQTSLLTQNILPDTLFYTNQFTKSNSLNEQHAVNFKYDWKLDSLATLKFKSASIYKTTDVYNSTYSESLNEDSLFVNNSNRTNDVHKLRKQTDNQLSYKQQFKKPNRLLLVTARMSYTADNQDNMLNAFTRYYQDGAEAFADTLDQQKIFDGHSLTTGGKITYSEPLSTKWSAIGEYSYNQNNATSHRNTYDKSFNGKYDDLNFLYSSNFNLNASSHTGTATMRYLGKKLKAAFGTGLSSVKLRLHNLDSNTRNTYDFLNVTPQANFGYAIKTQTNIGIRYQGNTQQPTIDQLQPLRDNSDPLNVFVGNPDLKVGFQHTLNLFYNSFKILSGRYMYVGTGINLYQNAITNSSVVDQYGKRIYTPVNVDGNKNWFLYGGFQHGQGEKKWLYGLNVNDNGGRNTVFINGQRSINTFNASNLEFNLNYSVNEKYNIQFGPKIGYNASRSSLRPDVKNNYFTYGGRAEGFKALPWKMEIYSDINFDLRQRINAFNTNTNIIYWNAHLDKKVFKKKNGKVMFIANDILNQNRGINRVINSNFVTDERYLRRSRYFLLKFEWSFSKMPGTETTNAK